MRGEISKAVLITGCSSGIGRATAELLASNKYPVYASARQLTAIEGLAASGCTLLELDVCCEASMRAAIETVEKDHGSVGILINNAGYGSEGALEEVTMEEVRHQFEVNVFGLIRLTQLVLPGMRRQGWGKIVNLSSMGGRMALPGGGIYHATKHAVEALSDSLRFEVGGFGVKVILIEPGVIKTEFGNTALARLDTVGNPLPVYKEFRATIKEGIRDLYEGRMSRLAAEPGAVARVIYKAISTSKPKDRYPVTIHARIFMGLRKWLGAKAFEAILTTQYKQPVGN